MRNVSAIEGLANILVLAARGKSSLTVNIARRHPEGKIHRVADSYLETFRVGIDYAFARGRKHDTPDACAKAVRAAILDVMPPLLHNCLASGGEATAEVMPRIKAAEAVHVLAGPFKMKFDAKDENAIRWAKLHAAELAESMSETTRDDVKEAIAASLEGEFTRAETIKAIKFAVGNKDRAELIARTETMMAANEGQRQAWQQAITKGLLSDRARRVWISTEDQRICPQCEALDGQKADMDGEYPGGVSGPPVHPNCRCTEGIA